MLVRGANYVLGGQEKTVSISIWQITLVGAPVKNFALLFCAHGTHHAENKKVGPFFLF